MIHVYATLLAVSSLSANGLRLSADEAQTRLASKFSSQIGSEAFVSLLSGSQYDKSYLKGFQALASSLLDSGTHLPFIALTTEEPTSALRSTMSCLGIHHLRVPAVKNPYTNGPRYATVMDKLSLFSLPFKRVVFLDADTVVLKNIDELFSGQVPFQAAADCGHLCIGEHFNTGVLAISPSNETYNDMLKQLGNLPAYDNADQGFLNSYFQHDWRKGTMKLPQAFNVLKRREPEPDFDIDTVKVVHNVGRKPWHNTEDDETYPVCHGAFRTALSSYEAKAQQCAP